jgi:hypothetical protein
MWNIARFQIQPLTDEIRDGQEGRGLSHDHVRMVVTGKESLK